MVVQYTNVVYVLIILKVDNLDNDNDFFNKDKHIYVFVGDDK